MAINFCFRLIVFRNSLETWYMFSGSASLLALFVFVCDRKRGNGGQLDFLIEKYPVKATQSESLKNRLLYFGFFIMTI